MRTVDINADLGESFGKWRMGNDERLVPLLTTANIGHRVNEDRYRHAARVALGSVEAGRGRRCSRLFVEWPLYLRRCSRVRVGGVRGARRPA